jgi:hypothetical protein
MTWKQESLQNTALTQIHDLLEYLLIRSVTQHINAKTAELDINIPPLALPALPVYAHKKYSKRNYIRTQENPTNDF